MSRANLRKHLTIVAVKLWTVTDEPGSGFVNRDSSGDKRFRVGSADLEAGLNIA